MSFSLLAQSRFQLYAKEETTQNTDVFAGNPAIGDFITCTFDAQRPTSTVPNGNFGPSFNVAAPIVTGATAVVEIECRMTPSGMAGTPPEIGRLLKACRMDEVISTSVGPLASTAGTTTSATLNATFGTTPNQYRGMPVFLAGNPAGGSVDVCWSYSAGRVALLSKTYGTALSASTTVNIPANVLYRETSDRSVIKTLTIYIYQDGLRHEITGCRGTFNIELRAGAPAVIKFRFFGQIKAWSAVGTPPVTPVPNTRQPPIWSLGMSQYDGATAQVSRVMLDAGVNMINPTNPEAPNGYAPPEITSAEPSISFDPYGNTNLSAGRSGQLLTGVQSRFAAFVGTTAGTCMAFTFPQFSLTDKKETADGGFLRDVITGRSVNPDNGLYVNFW